MDRTDNPGKGLVLVITTMSSFLTPFMGSSVNIALPSIGVEFTLNAVVLNWVATSYLLAAAVFLVPFGRMADIYGRRRIFSYGLIIYTAGSLLCAISTSAVMLISCRVVQGIGSAMVFGTSVAILTSAFPAAERGKALGINTAAVYIGLSLGPLVGGLLVERLGWRSVFYANLALGLVVSVAALWKLKDEWAEAKGEPFDLAGSIIYGLALMLIMFGLSRLPAPAGGWLIAFGLLALLTFIRWEIRARHPVLSLGLFRNNTVFFLSNLAALVNYSATSAVGFLLSLYLQYIKGFDPGGAGLVLVSMPVVQAILSPFTGRLSDKIEPRVLASTGMGVTCAGLFLFIFLSEETSLAFTIAGLVLLGLGFGFFSSPNANAVMGSVEKRLYGVGAGMLATMRLVGQMLSMGIALLLFALYLGTAQITPDYYPLFLKSVKVAFIIFTVLCFGGIFASLARGKTR